MDSRQATLRSASGYVFAGTARAFNPDLLGLLLGEHHSGLRDTVPVGDREVGEHQDAQRHPGEGDIGGVISWPGQGRNAQPREVDAERGKKDRDERNRPDERDDDVQQRVDLVAVLTQIENDAADPRTDVDRDNEYSRDGTPAEPAR